MDSHSLTAPSGDNGVYRAGSERSIMTTSVTGRVPSIFQHLRATKETLNTICDAK